MGLDEKKPSYLSVVLSILYLRQWELDNELTGADLLIAKFSWVRREEWRYLGTFSLGGQQRGHLLNTYCDKHILVM